MSSINKIEDIIKHYPFLISVAIIFAMGIALFAGILEEVYAKESSIINFDLSITQGIVSARTPELNLVFLNLTNLGNALPFLTIFLFSSILLLVYKKYISVLILSLTVLGGQILVYTIKLIIQRARPETIFALIKEDGFSFPSGHTFIAVCFWGVLGYLVIKHFKNIYLKFLASIIFLTIVLGIGVSRVYLGVHWASDVIASYSLATVYCIVVIFMVYRRKKLLKELTLVSK